jgi:hypothetical protein
MIFCPDLTLSRVYFENVGRPFIKRYISILLLLLCISCKRNVVHAIVILSTFPCHDSATIWSVSFPPFSFPLLARSSQFLTKTSLELPYLFHRLTILPVQSFLSLLSPLFITALATDNTACSACIALSINQISTACAIKYSLAVSPLPCHQRVCQSSHQEGDSVYYSGTASSHHSTQQPTTYSPVRPVGEFFIFPPWIVSGE